MKLSVIAGLLLVASNLFSASIEYLPQPQTDLVRHSYFTLSYNEKYEQANWVYYLLTDSMILKSGEDRGNNFRMDKLVPTKSAKSSDYANSGFDRGHLCPAGDMGFSKVAMDESFFMSNISPQVPEFNRGIWKELEEIVRQWALKEHQLYVVTGPVFQDNKGIIGKEEVLVPGHFFKILYDPTDVPKLIAFVLPNEKSNRPLVEYAIPVDEAEKLTGFDFFSQMPDELETRLESKVQLAGWFQGYEQEEPLAEAAKSKENRADINFYLILVGVLLLAIILVAVFGKKRR